jgi:hypothetical protein
MLERRKAAACMASVRLTPVVSVEVRFFFAPQSALSQPHVVSAHT